MVLGSENEFFFYLVAIKNCLGIPEKILELVVLK